MAQQGQVQGMQGLASKLSPGWAICIYLGNVNGLEKSTLQQLELSEGLLAIKLFFQM